MKSKLLKNNIGLYHKPMLKFLSKELMPIKIQWKSTIYIIIICSYDFFYLSIKRFFKNFLISLSTLASWKDEIYDLILFIIKWLIKIIHYELAEITNNALCLTKLILYLSVQYYRFQIISSVITA